MYKPTLEELIQKFDLKPLPVEGGYFVQTYRADEKIPPHILSSRYQAKEKPMSTAILFLLTPHVFSALHKLPTDEVYHFYLGDPVRLLQLYPNGESKHVTLGHDIMNGHQVQYVAPKEVWQGSYLLEGGEYALLGTTMMPGFTNSDYLGGDREALLKVYPRESEFITRLTRPGEPLTMPDED